MSRSNASLPPNFTSANRRVTSPRVFPLPPVAVPDSFSFIGYAESFAPLCRFLRVSCRQAYENTLSTLCHATARGRTPGDGSPRGSPPDHIPGFVRKRNDLWYRWCLREDSRNRIL